MGQGELNFRPISASSALVRGLDTHHRVFFAGLLWDGFVGHEPISCASHHEACVASVARALCVVPGKRKKHENHVGLYVLAIRAPGVFRSARDSSSIQNPEPHFTTLNRSTLLYLTAAEIHLAAKL